MNEKTFTVPNISCGHCVHSIKVTALPAKAGSFSDYA